MKSLFGDEIPDIEIKPISNYQIIKAKNKYQISYTEYCCESCINRITNKYHGKNYHKCKLIGLSSSEATDIRLRNVCNKYEPIDFSK